MHASPPQARDGSEAALEQPCPQAKSKNLSDRIAERIQKKPAASTAARNRSVFLSLRKEIQQAYTDGWSLLAIWQTLFDENRVSFTYQAFRRYARQLIDSPPSATSSNHQTKHTPAPSQLPKTATRPFSFSPKPTKEQLL